MTGSGVGRAENCVASEVLPGSESTNDYAERGTGIHKFLELVPTIGRDAALEQIDERWRDDCSKIPIESLPVQGNYATEVAFAYNLKTGEARELGRGLSRDYSGVTADEIAGTVDLVGVTDEYARVGDYKSGYDIAPAHKSRQGMFYALCAQRTYGVDRVQVDIIRVRPLEDAYYDTHVFDAFDLDVFAVELADLQQRINEARERYKAGEQLTTHEGDWCKYCPALYTCPAKVALVRSLAKPIASPEDMVGAITHETAARAWHQLQQINAVANLVKDRIYSLARSQPIPLGGGKYLGETTTQGNERLDGEGTYQAVRAVYGEAAAELAAPATRKATKKGIREALHAAKEQGHINSMARAEREILDTLRDTGCARAPVVTKVAVFNGYECANDNCNEQALQEGSVCRDCAIDAECSEVIK